MLELTITFTRKGVRWTVRDGSREVCSLVGPTGDDVRVSVRRVLTREYPGVVLEDLPVTFGE